MKVWLAEFQHLAGMSGGSFIPDRKSHEHVHASKEKNIKSKVICVLFIISCTVECCRVQDKGKLSCISRTQRSFHEQSFAWSAGIGRPFPAIGKKRRHFL